MINEEQDQEPASQSLSEAGEEQRNAGTEETQVTQRRMACGLFLL